MSNGEAGALGVWTSDNDELLEFGLAVMHNNVPMRSCSSDDFAESPGLHYLPLRIYQEYH